MKLTDRIHSFLSPSVLSVTSIQCVKDFGWVVRAMGCEGYDYVGGAAPRTEVVKGRKFGLSLTIC